MISDRRQVQTFPDGSSRVIHDGKLRARCAVASCGVAFVAVGGGIVGHFGGWGFIWLRRSLDHPFFYGVAAAGLMAFATWHLLSRRWLAIIVSTLCILAAFVWAAFGFLSASFLGTHETHHVPAPGGRQYKAVVLEVDGILETYWQVWIQQDRGLLSREWRAGCISGDSPANAYEGVAWHGSQLVVKTLERSGSVMVESQTGRPERLKGNIWGC